MANPQTAREFPSGATRSDNKDKPDYRGYLSPLVIRRYGQYMLAHQYGGQRASDNWKKGITKDAYLESAFRHFLDWWDDHEKGGPVSEETLCALLFNVQGYLHEHLKGAK